MWFAVFYNVSVRKASKALIMRDYDTTNITLIRQLIKMVGSDFSSVCRKQKEIDLWAEQQSGKRHHYEESVEKATKKKLSV